MSKNAASGAEEGGVTDPSGGGASVLDSTSDGVSVWTTLVKTLRHFLPNFSAWLHSLPDPRDPRFIVYPIGYMVAAGLMLFLTKLGARRQMRFHFRTPNVIRHLNYLCGTSCETMLHPDTLAYLVRRLAPEALEGLRYAIIHTLLRGRCLEHGRLLERWHLIAIDMTGHLVFGHSHCAKCLTQRQGGRTIYYHPVLEAKLITPSGLSLSVASEYVENIPGATVQDCERKAFVRLAEGLKRDFPQLSICLLLDSLYACGPVFEVCQKKKWRYIISFKEGSAPAVFAEYERLKATGGSTREHKEDEVARTYQWVNDIDFSGHRVHALECREVGPDAKSHRFVWVTDLRVEEGTYRELADRGGRLRWKIENEGFNIQKNNGYALEHVYSQNERALKNFYLLLQIAHLIAQLMEKGLLAKSMAQDIGAVRNVASLLLEELRCHPLDAQVLERQLQASFQIRFIDSS